MHGARSIRNWIHRTYYSSADTFYSCDTICLQPNGISNFANYFQRRYSHVEMLLQHICCAQCMYYCLFYTHLSSLPACCANKTRQNQWNSIKTNKNRTQKSMRIISISLRMRLADRATAWQKKIYWMNCNQTEKKRQPYDNTVNSLRRRL